VSCVDVQNRKWTRSSPISSTRDGVRAKPIRIPGCGGTSKCRRTPDRNVRLALRFLARTVLPQATTAQGATAILCQPVSDHRAERRLLGTPTPEAVKSWRAQTGHDFIFAWKASKFITQWKRLSAKSANSLELLESRLALLGSKAGPVLFQLPPHFHADADRLACFVKMLSKKRRYSFEFRHPSWYQPAIFRLLHDHNTSLCISDHHDAPAPWKRTADFVYLRGHGPQGRYKGHYSKAALQGWARRIRSWKRQGCDVFVYFDNDQKSAAPADARRLIELM